MYYQLGCVKNKPQLNVNKTIYVIFVQKKPLNEDITIIFNNTKIEEVDVQKYCSVWFQKDLCWYTHVEKLTAEPSKAVGCLVKLTELLPLWLKICALLYAILFHIIILQRSMEYH